MIIVYTGNGKGKTTAAIGLAIRALGHNQKVCIIQFLKSTKFETGEYKFLKSSKIEIYPMGAGFSWKGKPENHRDFLSKAWNLTKEKFKADYDLIVLDEINNVFNIKNFKTDDIISLNDLIDLISNASFNVVLTGREAKPELIQIADLVTEMKFIKHPYQKGVLATKAIEY